MGPSSCSAWLLRHLRRPGDRGQYRSAVGGGDAGPLAGEDEESPAQGGEVAGGPAQRGVAERAGAEAPDELDVEAVEVEQLLHAPQGGGVEQRRHPLTVEGPLAQGAHSTERR